MVYKNFDFNSEAKQFNARLASLNTNGATIQVMLDSLKGTVSGDFGNYHLQPTLILIILKHAN